MPDGFTAGTSEGGLVEEVSSASLSMASRTHKEQKRSRELDVSRGRQEGRNNDEWIDTLACAPSFQCSPELDEEQKRRRP